MLELRCAWRTRRKKGNPALEPGAGEVGHMDGGGAWGLGGATAVWGRDGAGIHFTVGMHRAESRFRFVILPSLRKACAQGGGKKKLGDPSEKLLV